MRDSCRQLLELPHMAVGRAYDLPYSSVSRQSALTSQEGDEICFAVCLVLFQGADVVDHDHMLDREPTHGLHVRAVPGQRRYLGSACAFCHVIGGKHTD